MLGNKLSKLQRIIIRIYTKSTVTTETDYFVRKKIPLLSMLFYIHRCLLTYLFLSCERFCEQITIGEICPPTIWERHGSQCRHSNRHEISNFLKHSVSFESSKQNDSEGKYTARAHWEMRLSLFFFFIIISKTFYFSRHINAHPETNSATRVYMPKSTQIVKYTPGTFSKRNVVDNAYEFRVCHVGKRTVKAVVTMKIAHIHQTLTDLGCLRSYVDIAPLPMFPSHRHFRSESKEVRYGPSS